MEIYYDVYYTTNNLPKYIGTKFYPHLKIEGNEISWYWNSVYRLINIKTSFLEIGERMKDLIKNVFSTWIIQSLKILFN